MSNENVQEMKKAILEECVDRKIAFLHDYVMDEVYSTYELKMIYKLLKKHKSSSSIEILELIDNQLDVLLRMLDFYHQDLKC